MEQLYEPGLQLRILAIVTALFFMIYIIYLVKNAKLKENFAIIWLLFLLGIVGIAIYFGLVKWISLVLGIADPRNTIYFLAIMFLLFIVILLSMEVSSLQKQVKNIIQETSLLKQKKNKRKTL